MARSMGAPSESPHASRLREAVEQVCTDIQRSLLAAASGEPAAQSGPRTTSVKGSTSCPRNKSIS